tara:strand:- start:8511 stop:8702 length:192 start_codon:yes stop_codon:yes gene_type:complete
MVNKLQKDYSIVIEDVIENIFITLALAFFFENQIPTVKKVLIITLVTIFYWLIIYTYLRPLYS